MKTTIPKVHRTSRGKRYRLLVKPTILRDGESRDGIDGRDTYIYALYEKSRKGEEGKEEGARKIKVCQYATTDRFTG